jgi:nitroreductase
MKVSEAIETRKSVRAFSGDAVDIGLVKGILLRAARAPSGGNLQPWRVYVLSGAARNELVRRVKDQMKQTPMGEAPEYNIYPPELSEPYKARRHRIGEAMYAAMGIAREDRGRRLSQFVRNWEFFGAPIGLIFTIDRQMQQGQWADLGMFMENVMLLAREHGLHTCPQEAWAVWHRIIREYLAIADNEMIFCGMAIGYADESAPINSLESERAELSEYATFREVA